MATISDALKARIEKWLKAEGKNEYGDPPGTLYAGGTPLFDERTGRVRDRFEYILDKHPHLRDEE